MKLVLLYIMVALYVAAGIYHFVNPRMYQKIMPTYLPWHMPLIYISGVLEIAFALLLLPESTRPVAAWLVIGLLVAIFPANIQMAVNWWQRQNPKLWIAILRLPLQAVLIYWAWMYTKK
ncbi:MAG TPA: MauE/DoxX family redox-associated membrane protein [Bacteroidia bacterium]|nr:MauE/DoxX family redox-associated membrane protein [Bacteroidia bacterium]